MFTLNISSNKEFYMFIMGIQAQIVMEISEYHKENPEKVADNDFYTKILEKHVNNIIEPHHCDEEIKVLICQLIAEFLSFVSSLRICLNQFEANIVLKSEEKKLEESNVSTIRN